MNKRQKRVNCRILRKLDYFSFMTGWTVIQRREDGSEDFYRPWDEYAEGFGELNGEFWLGNDKIHQITQTGRFAIRFDLEDGEGNRRYAEYDSVVVADNHDQYRLCIGRMTAGN